MDFRSSAERERQRLAMLRGDRRTLMSIAPLIVRASNWLWRIWFLGFAVSISNGAVQAIAFFVIAFLLVLLIWIAGKLATKAAAFADKQWK
jgi:hypothetical protein